MTAEWNKYGQIKHYECRLISKIKMSSTRLYKNVYSIEWDSHAHMHILKCFVTVKWMPAYFPEIDYDQFVRNVCMLFRKLFVFKNVLIKWSCFLPLVVGYCLTQIIMCFSNTCESVLWWDYEKASQRFTLVVCCLSDIVWWNVCITTKNDHLIFRVIGKL